MWQIVLEPSMRLQSQCQTVWSTGETFHLELPAHFHASLCFSAGADLCARCVLMVSVLLEGIVTGSGVLLAEVPESLEPL